jgi:DNA-binding PadR family transcriptional regulator
MPEAELPLAPAALLILFALASGDRHGYAIMLETRKLSDGKVRMGPATLYTTIRRLLESGWIKEVPGPKSADARRRYYRLTGEGGAILNLELERMETMVKKARGLRLRPAELRA